MAPILLHVLSLLIPHILRVFLCPVHHSWRPIISFLAHCKRILEVVQDSPTHFMVLDFLPINNWQWKLHSNSSHWGIVEKQPYPDDPSSHSQVQGTKHRSQNPKYRFFVQLGFYRIFYREIKSVQKTVSTVSRYGMWCTWRNEKDISPSFGDQNSPNP